MPNSWDKFTENEDLKADLVGGQLIGIVNGVHTVLGHINDGELILTDAGRAVKDALAAEPPKRRGRKPEAQADEAQADEPEKDIQTEFSDSVTTEDKLG